MKEIHRLKYAKENVELTNFYWVKIAYVLQDFKESQIHNVQK